MEIESFSQAYLLIYTANLEINIIVIVFHEISRVTSTRDARYHVDRNRRMAKGKKKKNELDATTPTKWLLELAFTLNSAAASFICDICDFSSFGTNFFFFF